MTRKDFELLASVMRVTTPLPTSVQDKAHDRLAQWQLTVSCLAARLATVNERFDSDRFIKACNGETVKKSAKTKG